MTFSPEESETVHGTTVALDALAVILTGPSGSGKSDLALRLIDRGWQLVSDDYTALSAGPDGVFASPPTTIAGQMEVRGIGIVTRDYLVKARLLLVLDLAGTVERMPTTVLTRRLAGVDLPVMAVSPFEPSAPIKVEIVLRQLVAGPRA